MKKLLLSFFIASICTFFSAYSQDHFSGIATSRKGGVLNANLNPAELANLRTKYELGIFSTSGNFYNNKLGSNDIGSLDENSKLYEGNSDINLRIDVAGLGPSFGIKLGKWAFLVSTATNFKYSLVNVNPTFAGIILDNSNVLSNYSNLQIDKKQRINAVSWGEVGLGASNTIYETDVEKLNVGVTLRLLFPGSYYNLELDGFKGNVYNISTDSVSLSNVNTNLRVEQSGNFQELDQTWGKLNGLATDIGFNYQWKGKHEEYKLNAGLVLKNVGSMIFNSDNSYSTNYHIAVPDNQNFDLSVFKDSLLDAQNIESKILSSGFAERTMKQEKFKVALPLLLAGYVDVRVVNNFYITVSGQRRIKKDAKIPYQNTFSITPRYSLRHFEVFLPISSNEISGFTSGLGFRAGFFFIGSNSICTALINNGKQMDVYFGLRFGFKSLS